MIGLGIITYNRPKYFKQCAEHILKNAQSIDHLVVYNDGSTVDYEAAYRRLPKSRIRVIHEKQNRGVAVAKNQCLSYLLEKGCADLFLIEDDILLLSNRAITGYIQAARKSGYEHLNFAHHGTHNVYEVAKSTQWIAYYPHCVGAFSYYTRHCLEVIGLLDEHFYNAFEHVEHTKRIADARLTAPFWYFADARESKGWLREIPGSLENSSMRLFEDWMPNIEEANTYWKNKDGIGLPPPPPQWRATEALFRASAERSA